MRRRVGVTAVGVLAVVTGACTSSDDDGAPPDRGTTSSSERAVETSAPPTSAADDAWTLTLDASRPRTYTLELAVAGRGDGFVPCGVTADGAAIALTFDPAARALLATAPLAATLTVTRCR